MDEANPSRKPVVRIVARTNGVGLDRDVQLIQRALPAGAIIEHHGIRSWHPIGERTLAAIGLRRLPAALINVLIERVPTTWAHSSGINVLIPNQERFPQRHLRRLRHVDVVLCKSLHAQQIFASHGATARYIGFTSVDRHLNEIEPDFGKFLHVAGRSTLKGTEMLLELWRDNSHWPRLTIVQHPNNASKDVPKNVEMIVDYLPDEVLRRMQNEHGIHLCPSLSEGWGHYIVEAMSCGALVVTTDGPPMNELVDAQRGIVVPWDRSEKRHLGTNYFVDRQAMRQTIETIIGSEPASLKKQGQAARAWFVENDAAFVQRAAAAIDQLIGE